MLIYKNKKYATTTNFQYECDRALDCQITFKRPDSKIKFLENSVFLIEKPPLPIL